MVICNTWSFILLVMFSCVMGAIILFTVGVLRPVVEGVMDMVSQWFPLNGYHV